MDFFRILFGSERRRDVRRDAHHDDFLDPQSGFWGDVPTQHFPNTPPDPHAPSFFWSSGNWGGGWGGGDDAVMQEVERIDQEMSGHFGQMFREFSELFQHIGVAQFQMPSDLPLPGLPQYESPPPQQPQESPREHMLKEPDNPGHSAPHRASKEHPHPSPSFPGIMLPLFGGGIWNDMQQGSPAQQVDTDLDGKGVSVDDILALPPTQPQRQQPPRPSQHFFRSFGTSIRTSRSADGSLREEVVKHDTAGNEERQVTETIRDGRTTTVTTRTSKDGTTTTHVHDNALEEPRNSNGRLNSALPAIPFTGDQKHGLMGNMFSWVWKPSEKPEDD